MNRVMGRAKILVVFVLILALGMGFFVGEYFTKSADWVVTPGSPYLDYAGSLGGGTVCDRDGELLLDLSDGRNYSSLETLRKSTLHWLGDRQGNISSHILSNYTMQIAGYNRIDGVYTQVGKEGKVTLTLSAKLQMAALEAMGDYKGTIALMNYETGELLCAVSTPNFDPDDVPDIGGDTTGRYEGVYLNRFTQSTYTPGSIFKIVTAAAALEEIPDILEQRFTCTGKVEFGVDSVTCEKKHGTQSFQDAFKNSCNCAFAQVAFQLGGETLKKYAEQFGVLENVSFDGITTASGKLECEDAADVLVAWSAIGQHKDLINPCAYLTFVSAVASGGLGKMLYLVSSIEASGKTTYAAESVSGNRIMSGQTASVLRKFMRNNVENYYGDQYFAGFTVCAKSGTAEVGGNKKPNAMFTGFIDEEEHPLAFIVVVEDGGYGRQICVPILEKVLLAYREEITS